MIVPGVKPPTGMESDETTRATATAAPAAGAAVGACDNEITARPQAGQKRLSAAICAEHDGHCTGAVMWGQIIADTVGAVSHRALFLHGGRFPSCRKAHGRRPRP